MLSCEVACTGTGTGENSDPFAGVLLGEAVEFTDPIQLSEHRDTDGEAYL